MYSPTTAQEVTMDARLNLFGNLGRSQVREARCLGGQGGLGVDGAGRDAGADEAWLRFLHRYAHQGSRARRGDLDAPQPGRACLEATVVTNAERAAVELKEQRTRIADAAGGVTDEAWANAAKHYDEDRSPPWCLSSP
jgi:hypothetical protein